MITAAALLALVLFITLLASGRGWNNVLSPSRNDLVFAGRNQAYGAYRMRREHHGVMLIAFLTSLGLVSMGLALPKLLSPTPSPYSLPPIETDDTLVTIFDAQPLTKTDPEPPKPKQNDPNSLAPPVAVDSVVKAPEDTTSRSADPDPAGPVGLGVDTLVGKGPASGGGGGGGTDPDPDTFPAVDVQPEYPGGMDALHRDLQRMVHYPDIDLVAGREGRVRVGFVVAEDGSMVDIVIIQGATPTMNAEALRVVKRLKKWKPGQYQGRDVKTRYSLPINFKLARQ